jgi:cell wall assembly regulator SMI1
VSQKNVGECWVDIEKWLSANAPEAIPVLPAGASPAAFAAAEETLGYALPGELRAFLAVHDGSGHLWLHDAGEFMSLATVLSSWDNEFDLWGDGNNDEWADPQGPIKKKWFTRKWLPVLDARTGDYVCIDLDPPTAGRQGQLIAWYHDRGPTEVIAPSFGALIGAFAAELASGQYTPRRDRAGQLYLEYRVDHR